MNSFIIKSLNTEILVESQQSLQEIVEGLEDVFAGRYLPKFSILEGGGLGGADAVIKWRSIREKNGFKLDSISLGKIDELIVSSSPPKPYVNEAPYFFLLQLLSREYVKKGYLMLTDTVSINDPASGETHIFMGYPHTGKSTLLALSINSGLKPLTTENTVIEVRGGNAFVVGGTNVLVYDPEVESKYRVRLKPKLKTKHGYGIIPIEGVRDGEAYRISSLYVIYCSFRSSGVSFKHIRGRKIFKILWHFSTSIIRGVDYYEPIPPDLSDNAVDRVISERIKEIASGYEGSFMEVFGSHREVLSSVFGKSTFKPY